MLEVTRLGIEVHNMKMRVESVSSRLDFDERRGRALESVVQYKPARGSGGQRPPRPSAQTPPSGASATPVPAVPAAVTDTAGIVATQTGSAQPAGVVQPSGDQNNQPDGDGERRRRRRRRRRRPGQTMGDQPGVVGAEDGATTGSTSEEVAGQPNAAPNVDGNPSSDSGSNEQ